MNAITGLLIAVSGVTAIYFYGWGRAIWEARKRPDPTFSSPHDARFPTAGQLGLGFITNFFDTLGIGSFAPTTAAYKFFKMVNDRVIPGTMNVGHTFSTTVQAFIFLSLIEVDLTTLISMIAASVLGAWLGAGVVAGFSKRKVQIGMGFALLATAFLMLMTQLQLFPLGGDALGVTGGKLVIAIVANLILGALMTIGIGMYAPEMVLVTLLGMTPRAAFPIMMTSCAFLMPVGSLRFIREKSYALRPALGLLIGGPLAVLLAAYIVKEIPLYYLRWLVIAVVLGTATSMLYSAFGSRQQSSAGAAEVEA
jgi:uncharacterized membrane protein YfcA